MSEIIKLRDYQEDFINNMRTSMGKGNKNTLGVAPTGAGKTVMFSYLTNAAIQKGKRVMILAHRVELLKQIYETLEKFNLYGSYIAAGYPFDPFNKIQIGSIMTVVNRIHLLPKPDLIIVDECHHYKRGSTYDKVLSQLGAFTIGVTATPCRLSGEPLGDYFQDMVLGPSTKELIDRGYLCDYDLFNHNSAQLDFSNVSLAGGDFNLKSVEEMMNKPTITGNAIHEYLKHCPDKRAVTFCASVKHAKSVAAEFRSASIPSMSIDGAMKGEERERVITAFKTGEIKVMTNCEIVTEGFDLPAIEAVIQLRPTASLSLYLQMVGRGLRNHPGKKRAIILDHVGNYDRHGLPCDEREWSLQSKIKPKKKSEGSLKTCEKCFYVMKPQVRTCPSCGFEFVPQGRTGPMEVDGTLHKVDKTKPRKKSLTEQIARMNEQEAAVSMDDLIALGKARGHKRPWFWAKQIFQARQAKKLREAKKP